MKDDHIAIVAAVISAVSAGVAAIAEPVFVILSVYSALMSIRFMP